MILFWIFFYTFYRFCIFFITSEKHLLISTIMFWIIKRSAEKSIILLLAGIFESLISRFSRLFSKLHTHVLSKLNDSNILFKKALGCITSVISNLIDDTSILLLKVIFWEKTLNEFHWWSSLLIKYECWFWLLLFFLWRVIAINRPIRRVIIFSIILGISNSFFIWKH